MVCITVCAGTSQDRLAGLTGDPSTTILHLKAKLKRAEEQRTADQAALQRMQQMLTSTQDNANLANSCLLKKVHAAQQATEAAHKTAAFSEQQRKADASAAQQCLEEKCASMQERIDKALVLTDKLEGKLAAYRLGQPMTAAKVAESEVYEPTAVHNPTDAYDPAAKGLQSVPAQSQQVQSTSSAQTVWLTAAQGHDSHDAQLGVQRQQHDLELATVHRQFAQQLAQIQQDHLHQLAAHSAQQPQQETRKQIGLLKQLFGSLPDKSLQLNPIEPSWFKLALVEQQREAVQAITEAQQLKYAGQLHEVQAQLAVAQQQFAHKVQELEQCQHALGSTEALHVQHILSMADLEQQLQAEKGTSSAQSQQLHNLQDRLVAAEAHSSQTSADMTALNMQLSGASKIAHSQEQLLQQLQSRAADAEAAEAQTASSMIALKQQLASKDRTCAFQEQQLSQLTHKLAATQHVDRIIALRGKLTAAEQAAKSQQALFSSYKVQHADQQRQLDQLVTASQAQELQARSTITALQQQVCELSKASQQQVIAHEQETASQMQTLQEAECQLAAAQQSIKEQLRAVQQQCDRQLSEQQSRHSTHIRALQAQHDSAVAALRQQVASSTGSQLAADDSSSIPMNIHLELMYKKVQQKVLAAGVKHAALTATQQQKVGAANAKQAALTADLQQQLQAKTLLVTRLQKGLAEQTRAAAAYKTDLADSRRHAANLKTDHVLANRASDLSNKASKAQCMVSLTLPGHVCLQ